MPTDASPKDQCGRRESRPSPSWRTAKPSANNPPPLHWRARLSLSQSNKDGSSLRRDRNILGTPPQALQIIIGASLFREHVHQKIPVVGQDPFRLVVAFQAMGQFAVFL